MKHLINKTLYTIVICLLISPITFAQNKNSQAPLLKLNVEINGENYQVYDGDSLAINGNVIKIKSLDTMTFDYGILTFDYPKHFAFEFEQDYTLKNWTLDGNNFVIMYFEYDANVELDMFIDEMVALFNKENCNVVEKNIRLGNLTLNGKRINVDLVGVKLTYDMYKLETDDFKSHFIAFQDSKNDDGSDSIEGIETVKLINETIEVK
jgi:hypothetical protein